MGSKDTRRQSRECAMQLLYEMDMKKEFSPSVQSAFLANLERLKEYEEQPAEYPAANHPLDMSYFNRVISAVISNLKEIDGLLESYADNWRIDRLSKVDLAVLRLSIAEICYLTDIPDSVSINEAVELAKKFGSDESGKFVNGVLGRAVKEKNT